jgi:hypothetical protein
MKKTTKPAKTPNPLRVQKLPENALRAVQGAAMEDASKREEMKK